MQSGSTNTPIKRALISVTDKTGLVDFARELSESFHVEIISTGGTAKLLAASGIAATPIEDYTGFPEMMGGRVKTLHPRIHGGLLFRRDFEGDVEDARKNNIEPIDLVCVNLYEFSAAIKRAPADLEAGIEHIDIGGPSMLRSAAKNSAFVTVVSDPQDYQAVLDELRQHEGASTLEFRRRLAAKVFNLSSRYDAAISAWMFERGFLGSAEALGEQNLSAHGLSAGNLGDQKLNEQNLGVQNQEFPENLELRFSKKQELRYGENPHQKAAFYFDQQASEHSLARAQQLQGKPLSYNNLLDVDAAWSAVKEFEEPACIVLKHQNPCGSAVATDIVAAYDRAYACDPISAYGGIIACNREVPLELVQHFADQNKQFVEVIIAPSYTSEALERLAKRKNLRVLATGAIVQDPTLELRSVDGGLLVQELDKVDEDPQSFKTVTKAQPTKEQLEDLLFAWKVCKSVKSNAILIARNKMGIGLGPGQPNRVDSAVYACERAQAYCKRAGQDTGGFVCASDAFFPFKDDVEELAKYQVKAIIQPGGSIRDAEVIEACDRLGIAMVFTGRRHFRH